jgi:hypothetical protein
MEGSTGRWRRRSRRLRRTARLLYVLGGLLVIVAILIALGLDDGTPERTATTRRPGSIPTVTVPPAAPAVVSTGPRVANTPPVITAPATIRIPASGQSLLSGLDLSDTETRPGDTFGVLVYSGQGKLAFGAVDRLRFYAPNGGNWVPFAGGIDAVRAALHSLRFTPDPSQKNPSLTIIVNDLGHQGRFEPRSSTRTVLIVPAA